MGTKNLFHTIVEGLQGLNNEGSSKRWAAFNYNALISYLVLIYGIMYWYVVVVDSKSVLHTSVEALLWPIIGTLGTYALTSLGLTTWEKRSANKKEVDLKKFESKTE